MKADLESDHVEDRTLRAFQLTFDMIHLTILGRSDQERVSFLDLAPQILLQLTPGSGGGPGGTRQGHTSKAMNTFSD
ncbi:MAG: hypothetical protein O7B35_12200 [Deltaproteobacteria bacterium]|nr:hypothetical protein [Deltaproteobacteria bacterium]